MPETFSPRIGVRRGPSVSRSLVAAALLTLAGCGDRQAPDPASPPAVGPDDRQTAFRVRGDFDAGLNSDQGWAAEVDETATVTADRPFRLRFEVDASNDESRPRRYRLQFRRNGGDWRSLPAEDFPYPLKVTEVSPDADWRVMLGNATGMERRSDDDRGHWRIETFDEPLLALPGDAPFWRPEEFSAVIRLPDRPGARVGLVFDYGDEGNFAAVELMRPDTVRLVRIEDGRTSVLATQEFELPAGRWFELNITIAGREATAEIGDGALVFSHRFQAPPASPRIGVHLPAESVADVRSLMAETEASTPRTSIVSSGKYEHGADTTDLLRVSRQPFTGGAGISFAEEAPAWTPGGGHGEWSFPIVIRRFADHSEMNESGDRFEYRLVETGVEALSSGTIASVRLEVPDGHLGGTFVETPMRLGPWQGVQGDLYFIMEPSETWNRMMVVKSVDGGRTWREVDVARRPETGDLEGLGSVFVGGRIHILHQVSDKVLYHAFDTFDPREGADRWAVRDEQVAAPPQPPTQVADLAVRSDGSVVAVYGAARAIRVRVRSPEGQWGEERIIDPPNGAETSGPTVVLGRDDIVHLAYTSADGSAWYRRIRSDGSLSEPFRFASNLGTSGEDAGAILPLLHLAESDSVGIVYRAGDGRLHERRVNAAGSWTESIEVSERTVVQNAVDSDQVGADAVADGDTIHVLLIEEESGHLFHFSGRDGNWREVEPVVTDANVQWVRGTVIEAAEGKRIYGFVYDAGSNGGSGMNRFGRILLPGK